MTVTTITVPAHQVKTRDIVEVDGKNRTVHHVLEGSGEVRLELSGTDFPHTIIVPAGSECKVTRRGVTTPHERCERLVKLIAEATGEAWTFGYIGNVERGRDDRSWNAFRPHPGRVGTSDDRIGGYPTDDLDKLADVLSGALSMARMLAVKKPAKTGPDDFIGAGDAPAATDPALVNHVAQALSGKYGRSAVSTDEAGTVTVLGLTDDIVREAVRIDAVGTVIPTAKV